MPSHDNSRCILVQKVTKRVVLYAGAEAAAFVRALITVVIHKLNRFFCGARELGSGSCSPKSEIMDVTDMDHGKYCSNTNKKKTTENFN